MPTLSNYYNEETNPWSQFNKGGRPQNNLIWKVTGWSRYRGSGTAGFCKRNFCSWCSCFPKDVEIMGWNPGNNDALEKLFACGARDEKMKF